MNKSVVVYSYSGELINEITQPNSPMYGKNDFTPTKIAADYKGNIYVSCLVLTEGLAVFNERGEFLGFTGANKPNISLKMILQRIFFSEKQKEQLLKIRAPSPTNVFVDTNGLVYTVTQGLKNGGVKKFNIIGENIFPEITTNPNLSDLCVDEDGNVYALSSQGTIDIISSDGNLVFSFGGQSYIEERLGLTRNSQGIALDDKGNLYVLDKETSRITVFSITNFGRTVLSALSLYNSGKYKASKGFWEDILKMNEQFLLAYRTLGNIYFKEQNYSEAFEYFKISQDNYEILFDKKSLNFVVQTKNQRWYSYAFEEDDQLNEKWYAYSKSSVAIECVNKDLTSYQLSLKRNGKVDRVTIKNDYILATVSFPTAQISFDLVINFENSDLKVKVPYESIKEKGEFKLISIELYPFLGATKGLQNGYYVVPEGSGILVNLSKNTKSTQPYVGRIYGPDIGLSSLSLHQNLNPGERLILPMYSIIKENSFVNVVAEEGDLYTYLKIYRAGITTNYNWITFKFVFREPYKRVINKKGDSVNWYQEKMNKFSPAVFYKFSDTQDLASFNDVAKEFKRYLVNSGLGKNFS